MADLKITSEAMVKTIESQMIAYRLAVNATKTQVMCIRRTQMLKAGGEFELTLTKKGKDIPKSKGILLGLSWDRDMSWADGKDNRKVQQEGLWNNEGMWILGLST